MRAIIISDADACALLDQLKLEALSGPNQFDLGKSPTLESMHRRFHFVVCRWLQEQGATVTR